MALVTSSQALRVPRIPKSRERSVRTPEIQVFCSIQSSLLESRGRLLSIHEHAACYGRRTYATRLLISPQADMALSRRQGRYHICSSHHARLPIERPGELIPFARCKALVSRRMHGMLEELVSYRDLEDIHSGTVGRGRERTSVAVGHFGPERRGTHRGVTTTHVSGFDVTDSHRQGLQTEVGYAL